MYDDRKRPDQWLYLDESGKFFPKSKLHQQKIMIIAWWSAIAVVHYNFLDVRQSITAGVYCNKLMKCMFTHKYWDLLCWISVIKFCSRIMQSHILQEWRCRISQTWECWKDKTFMKKNRGGSSFQRILASKSRNFFFFLSKSRYIQSHWSMTEIDRCLRLILWLVKIFQWLLFLSIFMHAKSYINYRFLLWMSQAGNGLCA